MKKLMVLCSLTVLILGGCAFSLGDDFTIPRDTKEKGTYIVDYNLQTYVPAPVAGEQAVKLVTKRGDLEASVTWKDQDGNELPALGTFQADTVYQAEIELTPREGYLFNLAINFAYPLGKIADQSDNGGNPTRIVTVIYNNSNGNGDNGNSNGKNGDSNGNNGDSSGNNGDSGGNNGDSNGNTGDSSGNTGNSNGNNGDSGGNNGDSNGNNGDSNGNNGDSNGNTGEIITRSQVTLTDLAAYIPAPVTGNIPVTAFSTTEYTGSVAWAPAENPFAVNTSYTATVTLNANEGYFFDLPAVFTHAGASSIQVSGGEDGVTITMAFPATTVRVVYDTDLSHSVTFPSIGGVPDTIFHKTSSQYTASTITWYRVINGALTTAGTFVKGGDYKARVTLTAAEGFTFTGTGGFTYASDSDITTAIAGNTGDTVTVDIIFPTLTLTTVTGSW
jgi:hypothetical protein